MNTSSALVCLLPLAAGFAFVPKSVGITTPVHSRFPESLQAISRKSTSSSLQMIDRKFTSLHTSLAKLNQLTTI
jgi:hypothetical protein